MLNWKEIYAIPSPQGLGMTVEEEAERVQEPEVADDHKETVSSRYSKAVLFRSSRWL